MWAKNEHSDIVSNYWKVKVESSYKIFPVSEGVVETFRFVEFPVKIDRL